MGLLLSASIDDLHVNLGASTPPKDWGSPFVFTSAWNNGEPVMQ
jgi:hypothetical protein